MCRLHPCVKILYCWNLFKNYYTEYSRTFISYTRSENNNHRVKYMQKIFETWKYINLFLLYLRLYPIQLGSTIFVLHLSLSVTIKPSTSHVLVSSLISFIHFFFGFSRIPFTFQILLIFLTTSSLSISLNTSEPSQNVFAFIFLATFVTPKLLLANVHSEFYSHLKFTLRHSHFIYFRFYFLIFIKRIQPNLTRCWFHNSLIKLSFNPKFYFFYYTTFLWLLAVSSSHI